MAKVIARKCPFTGTLFDINESKEYAQHLGTVRKELARERFERRADEEFAAFRQELFDYAYDFDDICDWLLANQDRIKMYNDHFFNKAHRTSTSSTVITKVIFRQMSYSPSCSNTHNAPIGKETNWGGKKDGVPRGYEGFGGRIDIHFGESGHPKFETSGIFKKLGIATGSGGGNTRQLGYGVTIWTDDFPNIKSQVDEQAEQWNKNYMITKLQSSIGVAGYPSFKPELTSPHSTLTSKSISALMSPLMPKS